MHHSFLRAIDVSMMAGGSTLAKVFLEFKERLLIYGEYCSHMEHAQNTLNQLLASREDFRLKVEVMDFPTHPPACPLGPSPGPSPWPVP